MALGGRESCLCGAVGCVVDPGGCVVVVPVEIDLRGFLRVRHGSPSSCLVWETWSPGPGVGLCKKMRKTEQGLQVGLGLPSLPLSRAGSCLELEAEP